MEKIKIHIKERGKRSTKAEVEATVSQGLAIHRTLQGKEWTVTHVSSGKAVTWPGSNSNMQKVRRALLAAAEEHGHSWEEADPLKWPGELLRKVKDIRVSYYTYSGR